MTSDASTCIVEDTSTRSRYLYQVVGFPLPWTELEIDYSFNILLSDMHWAKCGDFGKQNIMAETFMEPSVYSERPFSDKEF